jgi:tetratricopeptide (TPR) repeat protein
VADAIIELNADRIDEQAAVIAHHVERSGDALDAARWHERASAWTLTRDLAASNALAERALELVREDDSESADDLRLSLIVQILRVAGRTGQPAAVESLLPDAIAAAQRRDDSYALWTLTSLPGVNAFIAGDVADALPRLAAGAAVASQSPIEDLRCYGSTSHAVCLTYAGAPVRALAGFDAVVAATAGRDPDFGLSGVVGYRIGAFARGNRALAKALTGEIVDAVLDFEAAVRITVGDPLTLTLANAGGSFVFWLAGDEARAITAGREGIRLAEEWGARAWGNLARVGLGAALNLAGRHRDAIEVLETALDEIENHGMFAVQKGTALSIIARSAFELGDVDRAITTADAAVEESDRDGREFSRPWARLARAHVTGQTGGDLDQVVADLAAADRVIAETGQIAHQPFVHIERARVLNGDAATAERAKAVELFLAMGALTRAEAFV